ncbi:uncharacterized protein LOC129766434 [Toxorhynchites rutilus septentrionalis]|uniref:uncharacterized protein LOC129766434 n=1 Tax=Toxorhynchites rutilus septentrionalis TaxID=329112 RepID=UPI00247A4DCD|nr:uncharacterized protein LOC129766434 [Toxorhynchites rutilus septentrionalis]
MSHRSGSKSPAELLLGRRIRKSLELLRPPTSAHKLENSKQDQQFDRRHGVKPRNYFRQDLVWAKVFRNNKWHWEAGEVLERIGKVMHNSWLPGKQTMMRFHCNQLRTRHSENQLPTTESAKATLSILLDSWNKHSPPPEQEERPPLLLEDILRDMIPTTFFPPPIITQRLVN